MTLELEGADISRPPSIPCGAIDIGLIVYNERDLIGPTLAALLAAGFDRFVVLDMQSTDGTLEYIRETLGEKAHIASFPRRSLIEYGYAEARNTCAIFSTREWLLFVDADEVLVGGVENGSVILNSEGETPNIYSIKRNNLERDPENGPTPSTYTRSKIIIGSISRLFACATLATYMRPSASQASLAIIRAARPPWCLITTLN
jgi:glycosyltransferase involved in cell wall biosynthesis